MSEGHEPRDPIDPVDPIDPIDPSEVWRRQASTATTPDSQVVRRRAVELESAVQRRNRREYVAALAVGLFYGFHAVTGEELATRVGAALIVLGTAYVVVQLRRRGSPKPATPEAACVEHHRSELVRQRDLLRGIWSWYLLPLTPGLAVMLGGHVLGHPGARLRVGLFALFCALLFAGIGWINSRAARAIDGEIVELDRA